jgi:anthranilate phosphoribosyltransferase
MEWRETLESLAGGGLDRSAARQAMNAILEGGAPEGVVGAVIGVLLARPANPQELAGFADALRARSRPIAHGYPDLVDTCGTGGGPATLNLSTGAAIVAAAAGARVAKHGNRAVTSRCGSADVLEALGVRLSAEPERLAHLLSEVGIVFLFAPHHHPGMALVGPVRKALGVRTVFNQLGPLANPAGARRQLVGVYRGDLVRPMAEALLLLGAERGTMVVHGEDGLDEVSPCAPTAFAEVSEDGVREGVLAPNDFDMAPLDPNEIMARDTLDRNAALLREALSRADRPVSRALIPNAAVALKLAGVVPDLRAGANRAREAIASGAAIAKLEQLVEASQGE